MILFIKKMNRKTAEKISNWSYERPYSLYSMNGSEECIQELLNGSYYSVSDVDDNIIGFYCFGEAAQVPAGNNYNIYEDKNFVDIGLGMNPELCGKGKGYEFVAKEIETAKVLFAKEKLRLTVAEFNERAIRLYEKLGFKRTVAFDRSSESGATRFLVMELA